MATYRLKLALSIQLLLLLSCFLIMATPQLLLADSQNEEKQERNFSMRTNNRHILSSLKNRLQRKIEKHQHQSGPSSTKGELPPQTRTLLNQHYGPDKQQALDVYIPSGAINAPIILMVHGGAWMVGDKGHQPVVEEKVNHWLPKGYIVVSTNYRMSRSPKVLDQLSDIATALAYTQTHASEWGGSSGNVLLMGHSAGGHLVTLLASSPQVAKDNGAKSWLATISLDSAALNVEKKMQGKHAPFFDMVFGRNPSFWRQASPYHALNSAPNPIMIICSSKRPFSCSQAKEFAEKVKQVGGRSVLLPVDLEHSEINAKLGQPGNYTTHVEAFMQSVGLP